VVEALVAVPSWFGGALLLLFTVMLRFAEAEWPAESLAWIVKLEVCCVVGVPVTVTLDCVLLLKLSPPGSDPLERDQT
jgi:hypothetical protein